MLVLLRNWKPYIQQASACRCTEHVQMGRSEHALASRKVRGEEEGVAGPQAPNL